MIINYNIFQIFLERELTISLPSMKHLIQQHGVKYNGLSLVDLVRFALKDKQL
jgi:hypothetical protein